MQDDIDLDGELAGLDRARERLRAATARLRGSSVTGRSRDGDVTVRVDGAGVVSAVEIAPEAFDEHDEVSLGRSVAEAFRDAADRSGRLLAEVVGTIEPLMRPEAWPAPPPVPPPGSVRPAVPRHAAAHHDEPAGEPADDLADAWARAAAPPPPG